MNQSLRNFPRIALSIVLAGISLAGATPSLQGATVAKPAYETETWTEGRTLVWAHPGTSGKLAEAANWKDDSGKPATAPPNRDTDIILPAADTLYAVSGNRSNQVRHVTLDSNAKLIGRHRNEIEIWGNCHVRPGGLVKYVSVVGNKHTFFRMVDGVWPSSDNGHEYQHPSRKLPESRQSRTQISHKFQVAKYGTASVEFIGNIGVGDEVMLQHGKMIVSGDFRFSGVTGKGSFEIYDGGVLEIQSGGRIGPFVPDNTKKVYNFNIYRNGVIQAGSPERPLTSDAHLLLGFAENDAPGRTGLYAALGSMMRVYTTDAKKARLVIGSTVSVADFKTGRGKQIGAPESKAAGKLGTAMQLAGDIHFDGVHFDYVSSAGIALADPQNRLTWTNVTFGPHCAGDADELFTELSVNPNAYYHARGDMESEFNLTVMAMSSMDQFLEQADPFRLRTMPPTSEIVEVKRGKASIKTPVAVVFDQPIEVAVHTKVPGARLRYTLDGTEPTKDSPIYNGAIPLDSTTKIMVKGYKRGVGFSPTFSTTYVFKK